MRMKGGVTALALCAIVAIAQPLAWDAAEAAGAIEAAGAVRNVILIIADDMNVWSTEDGRPGDPYAGAVDTPSIDALASRGHVFRRAYANTSLCSPSRASFLSGRTPFETKVFDNSPSWVDKLVPAQTLPGVMKSAGFTVGLFGKVFHGRLTDPFRIAVADEYLADTTHVNDSLNLPFGSGPANYPESEHGDFVNTSAAIDFIGRHRAGPFFMALGLYRPHTPFVVPARYFDRYPGAVLRPTSLPGDLSDVPAHAQLHSNACHRFHLACSSSDCWDSMVKAYLASISFADAMIGRLVQAISDNGLNGSTAIVFIGDNGFHLGEKTIWSKNTLWDEAMRVPMIVVDPTRPGPAAVPATVQLVDIYPTILQLAGVSVPDWASGASLSPWLTTPSLRRPAIVSSVLDGLLVHTERFAYMRYGDGGEEFYDLLTDPYQHHNGVSALLEARRSMAARARMFAARQRLFLADATGTVRGTPLNDTLSGAFDRMLLAGGGGDDTYILHNSTVRIKETAGGGNDTVIADMGYRLPPEVENLQMNALAPGQVARGNDLANVIEVVGDNAAIFDGGGVDELRSLGAGTRFVLTPSDNAIDKLSVRSALQQKVDLRLFGASQTCSYDRGILIVNGERVARIGGDFVLSRDVVNGCGVAGAPPPAAMAAGAVREIDVESEPVCIGPAQ